MKRSLIAMLLCVLMLASLFPVEALAADVEETPENPEEFFETTVQPEEEVYVEPAQEPVIEEPVIEEPVVEEPVIEEPVIEAPVIEEPVIEEPVVEQPVTEEPVTVEPVIEEPVIEEPVQSGETEEAVPTEVEERPCVVVFRCEPETAEITVYSREELERAEREQVEPKPIDPEADESYLLWAGEYVYCAMAEGYAAVENVPFTILPTPERYSAVEEISVSLLKLAESAPAEEQTEPATEEKTETEETIAEETETAENPQPVRVEFVCEPKETVITVYDGEKTDENGEPLVIEPEEDGTYLLAPGEYYYDAECEGYESLKKVEFEVGIREENKIVQIVGIVFNLERGILEAKNAQIGTSNANSTILAEIQNRLTEIGNVQNGKYFAQSKSNGTYGSQNDTAITEEIKTAINKGDYQSYLSDTKLCNHNNVTHCNPFSGATQCQGYANYLGYALFGSKPNYTSWTKITGGELAKLTVNDLNPGDIIYTTGQAHWVVVWKVVNNKLYVADGNSVNGNGVHQDCIIHFGEAVKNTSSFIKSMEGLWRINDYNSFRYDLAPVSQNKPTSTTPTVTANDAIFITSDSAVVKGTITFPTNNRPIDWGVDIGTSENNLSNVSFKTSNANKIADSAKSGLGISFSFSKDAKTNPLKAGTKYFYQFWVQYTDSSSGQPAFAKSKVKTFTTLSATSVTLKDSSRTKINQTDATIGALVYSDSTLIKNLGSYAGGSIGIEIYDSSNKLLGRASDASPLTVNASGYIDTWYTVGSGKDVNIKLTAGTEYKYRFFINADSGKNYYSGYKTFKMNAGTTPTAAKTVSSSDGLHTYVRYDGGNYSWTQAESFCESLGGHLATITSSTEQNLIVSQVLSGCSQNIYFIGASDAASEGTWKCVTGESFSYSNWDKSKPEPSNESGENYAAIMGKDVGSNKQVGEWIDIFNAGDTRYTGYSISDCGFICEYDHVAYNANGGTGAPAKQNKVPNTALTLTSTKPTRANASAGSYTVTLNANGGSVSPTSLTAARTTSYTFENWNTKADGSGTNYSPGGSYTANAAATLYAQWTGSTVTAPVTLPTPTRSGYSFQGWATSKTAASGIKGNTSYTPKTSETLYATWKADTYKITYNANGGTGAPAAQTKTHDAALTLSGAKPTRADSSAGSYTVTLHANGGSVSPTSLTAARTTSYTFKNWNTKADGSGTSYDAGASYTANAAVTLYAQWTSSTTTAAVTLPTPTRDGYSFEGWATDPSATSGMKGSYTPPMDVTLYATWKANMVSAGTITVGTVQGRPGDEVTLDVTLDKNPGIMMLLFLVEYDHSKLEFLGGEDGSLTGWTFGTEGSRALWDGERDYTAAGVIAKLRFKIADTATDGAVTVSLSAMEAGNQNEQEINFTSNAGTVKIVSRLPGDCNSDGKVNGMDLVRLRRYLVGDNVKIDLSNADVTGDGKVNGMDLVRLRRYLVGDNVVLK